MVSGDQPCLLKILPHPDQRTLPPFPALGGQYRPERVVTFFVALLSFPAQQAVLLLLCTQLSNTTFTPSSELAHVMAVVVAVALSPTRQLSESSVAPAAIPRGLEEEGCGPRCFR